MTKPVLTREAFLGLKPSDYQCTLEDGTTVLCRELSETQFSEFAAWHFNRDGEPNPQRMGERRAKLVALSVINEDGTLMFPGGKWSEVLNVNSAVISQLFEQISERIKLEQRMQEQAPEKN